MKPINDRIWCNDFEVVYKDYKGYVRLLQQIASITGHEITDPEEIWFDDLDDKIHIKITYTTKNGQQVIWTERRGDYLNLKILWLYNQQNGLTDVQLASSYKSESIYFITQEEKEELLRQGIVFDNLDRADHFEFILYNLIMNSKTNVMIAVWPLLTELNDNVDYFIEAAGNSKRFNETKDLIRLEILDKLDWETISKKGIAVNKLYELINKPTQ